MKNIAVIFAGGVGSRMKNDKIPKQFLEWNGKAIIIHTLNVFEGHDEIDGIVLVCKAEWIDYTKKIIKNEKIKKVVSIVPGGDTALDSQYIGLKETKKLFPDDKVIVLIHDGVRPLVTAETITKNIDSVKKNGNAITSTKAIETVVIVEDDSIQQILDRSKCYNAKAPQSFFLDDILKVHELSIKENKHNYIDSSSMMIDYGYKLFPIIGETENIKITTPSDYYMFLGISKSRSEKKENEMVKND